MSSPIMALVVGAIVVGILGVTGSSALRRLSRAVAFIGFLFFGALAALAFYGSFSLASRGGGVLLFLALPAAFIAFLFYGSFSSSREHEEFLALPPEERGARTNALLESQIRDHERTIAENSAKAGRFWITPRTRRRLREEIAHSQLLLRGLRAMRSAAAEHPRGTSPSSAAVTQVPPPDDGVKEATEHE